MIRRPRFSFRLGDAFEAFLQFCFNTGRLLAAPVLFWLSAWMKRTLDPRLAMTCLGTFFLLGLVFLAFLPETHGEELPE